jgi:hypothetical protein
MVEVAVAGSLRPVSVGAGVDDVGNVADGAVQAADGATFRSGNGIAAPAVVDATWIGESGSLGGVGMTWIGDTPSHSCVGVEGDWSEEVVGVLGGGTACRVADGSVAGADSNSGERVSSSSSSWSHSSSNLFRRHLVFLAGSGSVSGEGGVGDAGGGVERAGGGRSAAETAATAAKVADGSDGTDSSHAAVTARLGLRLRQWRQRRLPAALSVTAGAGMLHETVKTWQLAVWLIFKLAFSPLATQR